MRKSSTRTRVRRTTTIVGAGCAAVLIALGTLAAIRPVSAPGQPQRAVALSAETDRELAAGISAQAAHAPLRQAADTVLRAVHDNPGSGYAGIVMDPAANRVVLSWNGPLPSGLRSTLDGMDGVPVEVRPAPYSYYSLKAELDAIVGRLRTDGPTKREAAAAHLTSIGIEADGSGLIAETSDTASKAETSDAPGVVSLQNTDSLGRDVLGTGVAVHVRGASGQAETLSREDQQMFGGAYYLASLRTQCSTGFAALNNAGEHVMVTAAHCISLDEKAWSGRGGNFGKGDFYDERKDIATIRASVADFFQPAVWDGAYWRSSREQFTKFVTEFKEPVVGETLCTSGAASGVRCNLKVTSFNNYYLDEERWLGPMTKAEHPFGENAVGKGDSGGPVFNPLTPSTVQGIGVISGGVGRADCTGQGGRSCYRAVYFFPMSEAISAFNGNYLVKRYVTRSG